MKNLELLKQLTIDEKIEWTSGNNMWEFLGLERLEIDTIMTADGPHGVRVYKQLTSESNALDVEQLVETTMFPSAAAMASTFNEELIEQVGETIGKECNMFGIDILLAPGVNQKRSPLGGRNFEYYSEDPFLSGRIGAAFINGVQSTGVGACVKHFAFNEQETLRRFVNAVVDERTMHEYYLAPFEYIIKTAKPYTVMSAYNKVNGHYASESQELLIDILRNKWHYNGAVISDWGGVQDKVKSIKTGLNLEMPGNSEFNENVKNAIFRGTLSETELDKSLLPLLDLRDKIMLNRNKGETTNLMQNHMMACKVAEEAIVLLENDGILPISNVIKIGVVGTFAANPRINGGGSATLKPYILENPLEVLKRHFDVDYSDGYEEENTTAELLKEVEKIAKDNELIIYFTGTTSSLESEGRDRPHMKIPSGHIEVLNALKASGKKIIVILNNGSAVDLNGFSGEVNAIIESWFLGGANAKALVDVLLGNVNPSGKLSETFALQLEHTPHFSSFPSKQDDVLYYGDIVNNGYRYYDTHKLPVRYPFGYGLSYTTFELSNLRLDNTSLVDGDSLEVKVTVTNTGNIAGKEVVQVYVKDVQSYYQKPDKELKGFSKVFLEPGDSVDVIIVLEPRAFMTYAVDFKEFRVESGIFEILVGNSSRKIVLQEQIQYNSSTNIIKDLREDHPVNKFVDFKPEVVQYLEDKYGVIQWYDKEQPMSRILWRIKRDFKLTNEEYKELLRIVY